MQAAGGVCIPESWLAPMQLPALPCSMKLRDAEIIS